MTIASFPSAAFPNPSFSSNSPLSRQHDVVLEEIVNAIAFGQNAENITLLVVRCNYTYLRETVLAELLQCLGSETLQGSVCTLRLNCLPSLQNDLTGEYLLNQLRAVTGVEHPGAVIVLGLEAIPAPEKLLEQLNSRREQLCHSFPFPILLWVTDVGYSLLSQYANDLESISGGAALLIQPLLHHLHQWLQNAVHNLFETLLQPNLSVSFDQRLENWNCGVLQRHELAIALASLRDQGYPITPDLQASISFVQGLQAQGLQAQGLQAQESQAQGLYCTVENSDTLFEQSAVYWQDCLDSPNAKLKRGLALFYLGRVRCQVANRAKHQNPDWTKVIAPLNECLMIFRQSDRPDLVSLCSTQLEKVLHHLRYWHELEQLVDQVHPLHQRYGDAKTLAQDYGFLAHIALHRRQWQRAADLTQQALNELAKGRVTQSWRHILYLKMLAESRTALGDISGAIQCLQAARAMGVIDRPSLHSHVLWLLQQRLRDQHSYLQAFAIKQERLLLEKQYGLRAFVGAGQLRSQPLGTRPFLHSGLYELEAIAPELAVSGRLHDLTELLNRIAGKIHKLIVIHGTSGVGKSSLVNGGLMPALQSRALHNRTNVPVMIRQYTNWQQSLLDAFTNALTQIPDGIAILQAVERKAEGGIKAEGERQKAKGAIQNLKFKITPTESPHVSRISEAIQNSKLSHVPTSYLLTLLRECDNNNLRPVLIFDQFEEFFFVHSDSLEQRAFFQFVADCLELPGALKIVLSLRQDYLHYLLEAKQLVQPDQWSQSSMAWSQLDDILSKHILYKIGNLSPEDARGIIQQLTSRTQLNLSENWAEVSDVRTFQPNYQTTFMHLEPALIDALVEDLAGPLQEVRPIEMQIVGAQLQTENICTLERYRQLGERPKEILEQRYLEELVVDCGSKETQQLAESVLFLLTDERGTRPLKTRSQLEREFIALLQPESNLLLDVLTNCLTQVPKVSNLQAVISKFSISMTQNHVLSKDCAKISGSFEQTNQLDQILYILCQAGVVYHFSDDEGDRYQLIHDYIAEMIRAKKAPQLYQLVADLEQERVQRKRIEQQKRIIEQEKQKLKQANTLLTQAKIQAGRFLLNSLFFSIVISNLFIITVFLWFYNFAPNETVDLLREDMQSTLKAAANGVDVKELLSLYQDGERNDEGFSDDPRYTNQLEWFLTVNRIEPRAWLYSFVITGPQNLEQRRPLSDAEFKDIPIQQHQTTWLVDLWAAYPRYRDERAAHFLDTQQGASSIAAIVKYQHKIVEVSDIYEDRWGAWLSAFAPLEDQEGKVVAILGLDLEADQVFMLQQTVRNNVLIAFFVTQSSFFLVYLTLWKRVQDF